MDSKLKLWPVTQKFRKDRTLKYEQNICETLCICRLVYRAELKAHYTILQPLKDWWKGHREKGVERGFPPKYAHWINVSPAREYSQN